MTVTKNNPWPNPFMIYRANGQEAKSKHKTGFESVQSASKNRKSPLSQERHS